MILDEGLYSIEAADVFVFLLAIPKVVFFVPLTSLLLLHIRNMRDRTTTYERHNLKL
jgi:hypothetical protein